MMEVLQSQEKEVKQKKKFSTSIPTPSDKPDSEIIFRDISVKYIKTTANNKLIGILKAIITVGLILLKDTKSTIIANIPP